MIFAIKTVRTQALDTFVERFRNPPNISMALLHSSVYVENKVDWIGDLLVFRQKSLFDGFAKFGIVSSLGIMLLSLFLKSSFLFQFGFICVLTCMCVISPLIRFLAIALKLFFMGHRSRIKLVNNNLLIEQLFFDREVLHGSDGSL